MIVDKRVQVEMRVSISQSLCPFLLDLLDLRSDWEPQNVGNVGCIPITQV